VGSGDPSVRETVAGPLERDADFDEAVDSDGPVVIRGRSFSRSEILASDVVAYREALEEYREEQLAELLEAGTERFPHPIAHCLYRYLYSAQTENQRLQFLKDTWESFIAVVFALAVAEVRSHGARVPVASGKARDVRAYIHSRNIRDRLEVLRTTVDVVPDLPILQSLVDAETIANMIALNQRRNEELAHVGTLNERQSTSLILDVEPEVLAIFRKARALENADIARYLGPAPQRGLHKLEVFRGHSSSRRIEVRPLPSSQAALLGQYSPTDVLAICGDRVLALSPVIVWREGRGHRSELAFMKKKRVDGTRAVFMFEVFGDAEEFESDVPELQQDLDAIKRLYDATNEEQRP